MRPLSGFGLVRPRTLADALEALTMLTSSMPVAGGTDVVPMLKEVAPKAEHLVDLSLIPELSGVSEEADWIRIGATTTHASVLASGIVKSRLPALRDACGVLGSVQIRNRGTVGGNLCNASPAADTAPPLLAHGAEVEVANARGIRRMPLRELFEGPKKTVLRHGELLTSIWVPTPPPGSASAFARIGRRAGFCLSVVNCAAYVERDDSKLGAIRIALGSVAPTPIFISGVEKLAGRKMTEGLVEDAGRICSEASEPVDDLRGTAEYRREMSAVLARRTLREAWRRTGGEQP